MMLPKPEQTEEVTPQLLSDLLENQQDFVLIDCRELEEWHFNRIEGARHLPLSQFPDCTRGLLTQTNTPMIVYCHHGMRSLHATRWLRQQGCNSVFSLQGGIAAWSAEIDQEVPCY